MPVLLRVVDQLDAGTATPQPQDHSQATYARRLSKADGEIRWSQTADEIACHVRAMQPWPKAFSHWQRPDQAPLRVIIPRVSVIADTTSAAPGTVLPSASRQLVVKGGRDAVALESLQPDGKRPMNAADFLRGYPIQPGQQFGDG